MAMTGVLKSIPGSAEVNVEQTTGLPMLTVNIDRDKATRYGLNIADVQDTIATAIGGRNAGTLFEGDRRFDIVVRLPDNVRGDLEAIKRLPIALPASAAAADVVGATSVAGAGANAARVNFIPLGEVATLELAPGPNQVSREDGKRRIVVSANVRGRDLGSFVSEATGHSIRR
jgi:cobalt-zinc-cadmium resistance protein CzcA